MRRIILQQSGHLIVYFCSMPKQFITIAALLFTTPIFSQLPVVRDTMRVMENGYVLKMPWANGLNFVNVSSADLNLDGRKDLVVFDHQNQYSQGHFRCFINTGLSGKQRYRIDNDMAYMLPLADSWATFVDYDHDGREDLFCAGNNLIKVYRNVSTSSNTPAFVLFKKAIITNYNPGGTPFNAPLYSSVVGVPGITDVDNDGDYDILTFTSSGFSVDFHKNMSKELYGNSDSLVFENLSGCWGDLFESNCGVDFNQCNGRYAGATISGDPNHKELHAGSCLACLDADGDLDKDIVMGDITCDKLIYVHNSGNSSAPLFNDTSSVYPNFHNNNTLPVRLNNFPCAYFEDVDGDNVKDLLASPNTFGSDNFNSLWYYQNTSSTGTVNFSFVKKNFLQDEMIEVGQNSFPVLFDYDLDGKKDLLIGNYGYYMNKSLAARLTLYRNTGTSTVPSFSLITRDYGGLSAHGLNFAIPTVGDIDGDGDVDICIGTSAGQVHWLQNTAGQGNPCNFSVFKNNPFQFTANTAIAAPQLFDLDQDGKLDLILGNKRGRLSYYRNIGTATTPSFTLITDSLGKVDVSNIPAQYGTDGYSVPFFYNDNGMKLLVGSVTGKIYQYSVPANVLANYNLVSSFVNGYYEGAQSSVCYEDLNGDSKRDLLVGNVGGGLSYFTSNSPFLAVNEVNRNSGTLVSCHPNPAAGLIQVEISGLEVRNSELVMKDLSGREVLRFEEGLNQQTLNISSLATGVYLLEIKINNAEYSTTKKIVKQD